MISWGIVDRLIVVKYRKLCKKLCIQSQCWAYEKIKNTILLSVFGYQRVVWRMSKSRVDDKVLKHARETCHQVLDGKSQ